MMFSMFDLSGLTPRQREITEDALRRCDFDFSLLAPALHAKVGRSTIPVEWADLSRYAVAAGDSAHGHVHEKHDEAHIVAGDFDGRRAALGLAWYSGKVSVEKRLENDPELAIEVFLAEGAHMVDFFYMTDEQRKAIFSAYHGGSDVAHGHGWFEETGSQDYWSWIGESFMSGFIFAYCKNVRTAMFDRQPWVHRTTPAIAAEIRAILSPPKPPADEPEQPPAEEPEAPHTPAYEAWGARRSKVFHVREHRFGYSKEKAEEKGYVWATELAAVFDNRRHCRICRVLRDKGL